MEDGFEVGLPSYPSTMTLAIIMMVVNGPMTPNNGHYTGHLHKNIRSSLRTNTSVSVPRNDVASMCRNIGLPKTEWP